MFILTAWGNQRELICHKESNTTRRRTPRGACQCTLCSYSPGVKSLWDDPQNTLLRSMQHAQSSPRVGMGQDTFHRQLSAPTPPWYTSEDTNRSHAVRLSIKTAYTNIQRFRSTKVALCAVCTMIKYMTKNHSNVWVDKRWNCAVGSAGYCDILKFTLSSWLWGNLQFTPWWSIHEATQSLRHIMKKWKKDGLSLALWV